MVLARAAVEAHLRGDAPPQAGPSIRLVFDYPAGAFVTIRQHSGELRGCIGASHPTCATVVDEVLRVAPLAATQDPRFPALIDAELAGVSFEISILTPLEPIADASQLDAARFGVSIQDAVGRRALLLPDIPGIDSVESQLFHVRRKAGIPDDAPIDMWRFEVLKFNE